VAAYAKEEFTLNENFRLEQRGNESRALNRVTPWEFAENAEELTGSFIYPRRI
jgi:hypothetical protein